MTGLVGRNCHLGRLSTLLLSLVVLGNISFLLPPKLDLLEGARGGAGKQEGSGGCGEAKW